AAASGPGGPPAAGRQRPPSPLPAALTPSPTGPAAPRPPFVQRAATPAALPVEPSTTAVPLRPTTPIFAATPLPVAPLHRPTVQRDALPTSTVKETPVTSTRPDASTTRAERRSPPPDDPPPSYSGSGSGSGSGSSSDDPPPGYKAVEEGGFDPRALTEFQVDALVHRIIDRITRHVRTELRRDRERVGKLRDFRS
ncbi:hypothetical protein AB0N16_18160, partial [Streptomyces sp. NPDC051105]|uniref:hypothetical protein n=1 Tax=Streptomyces sp. NPDC051105 TaxID=3154843 RepID=UPI00343D1ADD